MESAVTERIRSQTWDRNSRGYDGKAFHLVCNRYRLYEDHGVDRHQDICNTYDTKNPIVSLSYGCGAVLEITDNNSKDHRTAVFTCTLATPS